MYKIYADDTLIYDSTIEDYKIGKGTISLEVNKSGSFVFSVYPDHFFYDKFVRLKTVITVYRSEKIVFRGRILNDVTDYWNNKVITCEGELGFLQDSIIRPFTHNGSPITLFTKLITDHNAQVDEFKQFKIGTVTIKDPNNLIVRSNTEYDTTLNNLNSRLIEDSLGGYFYITHGEDGTDPIPTINYLGDFTNVASQVVEFGTNLKNYTKTIKAENIATAIIPLGATVDDGNTETTDPKLTIKSVNAGSDYVYSAEGVALYGWIFKTVSFDDVTNASTLKSKAEQYLKTVVEQNITVELNAIDLHLLDRDIESINVCDYVRVISTPHNFDSTLLCNKQTLDLLKPENDSLVLGYPPTTMTANTTKTQTAIKTEIKTVQTNVSTLTEGVKKVQTEFEIADDEIRATVSSQGDAISGLSSSLTLTNNSISAIVTSVGDAWGNVTPASIVAAINSSGSSVKISANHVDISGFVTFSALATPGSTVIDGSNIMTGEISASRIGANNGNYIQFSHPLLISGIGGLDNLYFGDNAYIDKDLSSALNFYAYGGLNFYSTPRVVINGQLYELISTYNINSYIK